MSSRLVAGIVAGIFGTAFLGYCVYFDHKRRSDPLFRKKLKEKRQKAKKERADAELLKAQGRLPDMSDQNAVQMYFMEEVAMGEEFLAKGDHESCVQHLTNAIAVCGQPQQLLQVFQQTLPPEVFRMLINNITSLPSAGKGSVKEMDTTQEEAEAVD